MAASSAARMKWLAQYAEQRGTLVVSSVYWLTRAIIAAVAFLTPFKPSDAAVDQWWIHNPFLRWDAGHYLLILTHGYPGFLCDTTAFFPAYALATWPLAQVMDPGWALVIISHLSGWAVALLLHQAGRKWFGPKTAVLAATLFCVFPTAMFLSTGYADAFFFLWVAATLWAIAHERVWLAAVCCGVATGSRPTGLPLAVVVVLWVWMREIGPVKGKGFAAIGAWLDGVVRSLRRSAFKLAGVALVSISGMLLLFSYFGLHYGRVDAYFACQEKWVLSPPRNSLEKMLTLRPVIQPALEPFKCMLRGQPERLLHQKTWTLFVSVAVVIAGMIGFFRPGAAPQAIYLLPLLVFLMGYLPDPVSGGRLIGMSRYQLAALPGFLALGRWPLLERRPMALSTVVVVSMFLQCVFMHSYVAWEPAF